jgi:peptidoglycan/xylan/chitin deacetylase (PgdA/CDA1 family)
MYHRLESSSCPVTLAGERKWAIPARRFEAHMRGLREAGRQGVSMDQVHRRLCAGESIPGTWVAITFDDGNASDYRHALPVLAGHGFHATFFVCGERVGAELLPGELRSMHEAGMHIGSHAMRHRFLTTLEPADEEAELVQSRRTLEELLGAPVTHFAPPGGRWSSRTREALRRAGYEAVSTSRYGFNPADSAKFAYCRLPVLGATSSGTFDAMVNRRRYRLLAGYARATAIAAARSVLGESGYGRARNAGGGAL